MDVEIWSEFTTKVREWAANQDPSDKLNAVMLSLMLGDNAETDDLRSTYWKAIHSIGGTMDGFLTAVAEVAALSAQAETERLELLEEEGIEWDVVDYLYWKWICKCGEIFLVEDKQDGPFAEYSRSNQDYSYREPEGYDEGENGICINCVTGDRGECMDCNVRYTIRKCEKCDEYVCSDYWCKQDHLCPGII